MASRDVIVQVLWAKQSVREDADLFEVGEQRENVDGDSLSFLIPNLEPDTSYRVQVRESSLFLYFRIPLTSCCCLSAGSSDLAVWRLEAEERARRDLHHHIQPATSTCRRTWRRRARHAQTGRGPGRAFTILPERTPQS